MSPYRRHTPPAAAAALDTLRDQLETYRSESQRLADELGTAVRTCVQAGATWGEVGKTLGISKQAARAHWAPYLPDDASADRGIATGQGATARMDLAGGG
jgi:hypothetical protein